MGIDNLLLSPEIIAALYPESLVEEIRPSAYPGAGKTAPELPVKKYAFRGKNLRSICFLIFSPNAEFIAPEAEEFLHKILAACKIKPDDIAIINSANQVIDLLSLKVQFKPRIVFIWGPATAGMDILNALPDLTVTSLEDFLVVPVRNAYSMNSDDQTSRDEKQKLWKTLKNLFNL